MQNLLDQPGSYIDHTEGGVYIRLQRTICGAGITRYVQAGADRIPELCTTYTDERIARTHTSQLLQDLRAGQSIDQICGRLTAREQAVLAETEAVVNAADTQLAADINATMDEVQQRAADADRHARAAVQQITDEVRCWSELRSETRPVRPTLAGAHLKNPTPVQVRAARAHRDGVVHVQPGIASATLRSMARKGYGTPRYQGRRYEVVALVLNERGHKLAETKEIAA